MARYIVQQEIGRGSWSVVYKAVDDVTHEVVAVKELIRQAGVPRREVSIGRQVTHVNVCRIFDYFERADGASCIAMEFVGGGNLRNLMERSGQSPVEMWLSIARQILDGLEAAHGKNIVHRDLKPENILLTSDGAVKVTDFGHARVIGTKPSLESERELGTRAYIAPEQAMGRECDARTDIFSFGVILYEMLSGKRPESPAPPLPLPSGVPAHIERAIRRCLENDPARRFASVSELRNALAGTSSLLQPVRKLTAPLLVSGVIVFSLSTVLWNHFWFTKSPAVREEPKRDNAQPQQVDPRYSVTPPVEQLKSPPALAQKTIQRVAVMDFENLTGEKSLDAYTVGISETLSTELAHVRGLTLVERSRVTKTGIPSAGAAQETGKLIGADYLVVGSFQKLGDTVRLTARVINTETSEIVPAAASVDGAFRDLFKLQAELAKQLAVAIQGASQVTGAEADSKRFDGVSATGRSLEAFEAFSDGLYFLRDDLAADALSKFDLTLAIDRNYPGAHHYRGMALAKLNRLDEAIDAFKRALPGSEPEQLVLWSWDAPFALLPSSPPSASSIGSTGVAAPQHGIIRAVDSIQVHLQRDLFAGRKAVPLQKRIVYGERAGKATVLHFLDLERHAVRRLEIPDENIVLNTVAQANGSFTVLSSVEGNPGALPRRIGLYAFAADSSRLWQMDLTEYGKDLPRAGLIGDAFYIHLPGLQRFDLIDARTGSLLWRREGLPIDAYEPPQVRHTKAYGDILIIKSPDSYRAIRMSNGTDAWTVQVHSPKASDLANNRMLIVFEPERRIFTVDLETGKTVGEVNIEQYVDAFPTQLGPRSIVGAVLEGNTLYVLSSNLDLYAIDLTASPARPGEARLLWHTPIQKKIQSIRVHGNRVYLGTDTGELIIVNAATGAIATTTKLAEQTVLVEYAGDDAVLMRSANTLYGLGTSGAKKWEYSSIDPTGEMTYLNGVITVYTSPLQMSALDVASGKLLWQYADSRRPYPFATAGRFFILGENGVKEYSIGPKPREKRPAAPNNGVTDKETLTELARMYLAKTDLEQARVFAEKASAIDANYPPLTLVQARLLKAQGASRSASAIARSLNIDAAERELARYASLVGLDSKEGQQAISDIKRDYGLLWETAIGPDVAGDPVIIENRLVSVAAGPAVSLQSSASISRAARNSGVTPPNASFLLWRRAWAWADRPVVMRSRSDVPK